MEQLEELLQQLINPETEGDPGAVFEGIRSLFAETTTNHETALGEKDSLIGEHEATIEGNSSLVSDLETKLLETKAANYDAIMANGREVEGDPDLPTELDEEADDDYMSYDDAFESKEDKE